MHIAEEHTRGRRAVPTSRLISIKYVTFQQLPLGRALWAALPRGAAVSQSGMSSTCPAVPIRQLNLCKQNHLFPKRG